MTISQKAMLAGVKISAWSARKLDRKITDEVNATHAASADAGRYNKALISKAALAEIMTIAGRARAEHYARTLPWADNGNRILPSAGYQAFAACMRKLGEEFDAAVSKFVAGYPAFVDDARVQLNGMFNADDYPAPDEIARKFSFKRQIWPMPDSADFRVDLSEGEADRIREDIKAEFDAAVQMAMRDVYSRIAEVVSAMSEKLRAYRPALGKGDKAEGIFRDSLVGNIRDLVTLLPSLNMTGDATLAKITARMEKLCRYDAEDLRDDATVRNQTADAAAEILAEVNEFLA